MGAGIQSISTPDSTYDMLASNSRQEFLQPSPQQKLSIAVSPVQKHHYIQCDTDFGFVMFFIIIGILLWSNLFKNKTSETADEGLPYMPPPARGYQVFSGKSVSFNRQLLHDVLTKYFIYYSQLTQPEKARFIARLQKFIAQKTFIIPAADGYREMPILISASAIQLTFGLKDYLLPWFENICVHPAEYVLPNPLRTLAGNVSGNTITLSWKHFLSDYQNLDGVNVGLHEMAHALQLQCEYFYKTKGRDFRENYDLLETIDEHIISKEKVATQQLYSNYALTNTDEFWASSVELFFEKPAALQQHYPEVYEVLKALLKQDLLLSPAQPCLQPLYQ